MKIGIISDTHDNLPAIEEAMKIFNRQGAGLIIHCGDWVAPFSLAKLARAKARIVGIFGNVDGERDFMKVKAKELGVELLGDFGEKEVDRIRIAIIHGKDEQIVNALGKSAGYDIVLRGHTHIPDFRKIGDTLTINPGEACGYLTGKRTVAIFDTESMKVEIIEF